MIPTSDKLPKVPIGTENLIRFYLFIWPVNRTQVEVAKALKIKEPAIRTTAKILKESGLLTRIFSEEYSPNIVLSVPIKEIVHRICLIVGENNVDKIESIALEDRKNFRHITISKIRVLNKENLNWKIANVLYKESITFLFREILTYGKMAKKNKIYERFLNRIGFKTVLRQDMLETVIKKQILSKEYQYYPIPKFNVVFYKPEEEE